MCYFCRAKCVRSVAMFARSCVRARVRLCGFPLYFVSRIKCAVPQCGNCRNTGGQYSCESLSSGQAGSLSASLPAKSCEQWKSTEYTMVYVTEKTT